LRPCSAQLMAGVNDQPLTVGDQQRRGMIFGDEMRAEANGQQSVSHRHHNELWLTAASNGILLFCLTVAGRFRSAEKEIRCESGTAPQR